MRSMLRLSPHPQLIVLALAATADRARCQSLSPAPLDVEIANHTPSRMRGMTTTPEGSWLFQSEGGTMVFLHADEGGDYDMANMTLPDGKKRVPIGEKGVLAARVMLDPDADRPPKENLPGDVRNLLYIAAGDDGLWIMEADVTETYLTNKAWRVDDSGNATDPTTQGSRRYCCDVDVMQVGSERYLLALFTKKNHSVLRAYPLSAVRAIADPAFLNPETGSEISPSSQVVLGAHPNAPAINSPVSFCRSVALAMAVDQRDDGGTPYADVYVAMGPHGVFRVTYPAGGGTPTKAYGPVFGTGSAYDSLPLPPGAVPFPGLYKNLVHETNRDFIETAVIEREEAPFFTDVAVYRGLDKEGTHQLDQLFAAVDHLNWVAFDLNAPFDHQMPILHHEGEPRSFAHEFGFANDYHAYMAAEASDPDIGYARSLSLLVDPQEGPILAVTSSLKTFVRDYGMYHAEGVGFDERVEPGRTWTVIAGGAVDPAARTLLYRIEASYPSADNWDWKVDFGGEDVYLPPLQPRIAMSNELVVFHNYWIPGPPPPRFEQPVGICASLLPVGGGAARVFPRSPIDIPGRLAVRVTASVLDPNLLLPGGNDGGVALDGFLATGVPQGGGYEIKRWYAPPVGEVADERGSSELFVDGNAQWVTGPDRQVVFTSGRNPATHPELLKGRFKLIDLEITGPDAYNNEPEEHGYNFLLPPKNRFDQYARLYYESAYSNWRFDAFLQGQGHTERRLFGAWFQTPEGLVVMDRQNVMDNVDFTQIGREVEIDNPPLQAIDYRLLVAHPEFSWMQAPVPQSLKDYWSKSKNDRIASVGTWPVKLVEVQEDRWVLAVPCGAIEADPDWNVFETGYPGSTGDNNGLNDWFPPAGTTWATLYGHGMVQFWEMKEEVATGTYWPEGVTINNIDWHSPLKKIIAPDPDTNIWVVEPMTLSVGGTDKTYLFCGDFGGKVYVYEITDVVNQPVTQFGVDDALPDSFRVTTWEAPQNLFDDQPSEVFDIAVDPGIDLAKVYVGIERVGIEVLEFDPLNVVQEDRLQHVERIQTPGWPRGLDIRTAGERQLVVTDYDGGIRIFAAQ